MPADLVSGVTECWSTPSENSFHGRDDEGRSHRPYPAPPSMDHRVTDLPGLAQPNDEVDRCRGRSHEVHGVPRLVPIGNKAWSQLVVEQHVNLPSGSNMMWDTTMPLAAVCLWPVTAVSGVIAAWNVGVVAALVLDGWCTLLWSRRHSRHAVAAWMGVLLMVLGPYAAARAHQHLNLLVFFLMPLLLIEVEKFVDSRRRRPLASGARAGLLVAVQSLLCEEIVALEAVALGTVVVIGLFGPLRAQTCAERKAGLPHSGSGRRSRLGNSSPPGTAASSTGRPKCLAIWVGPSVIYVTINHLKNVCL